MKEFYQLKRTLEILSRIHASLRIEEVLRNTLQELVSLFDAEAGSLWEVDQEKEELHFKVIIGAAASSLGGKKLKMGEGIAGWVAKSGKTLIVSDVAKDSRWRADFDKISHFKTKNIISFPLKSEKGVIGVIQLLNYSVHRCDGEFVKKIVDFLSGPFSIALENAKLYEKIKKTFRETALALATAVDKRDPTTGGHTRRVLRYTKRLAENLGLAKNELEEIEIAAILHDIGKIGIPDAILLKKDDLTEKERKIMESHVLIGAEILKDVEGFEKVVEGVKYHHERWNGSGYPEGLKGEEIPLYARIISICDVFDALTSCRPYKKALSEKEVLDFLEREKGNLFWPEGVDVFVRFFETQYHLHEKN